MPTCVAFGCTNRTDVKSKKQISTESECGRITFHRFPKDPEKKHLWVQAVCGREWSPTALSVVCSIHFKEECFNRTSTSVVCLRDNAVPTIFLSPPHHMPKILRKRKPLKQRNPGENNKPSSSHNMTNLYTSPPNMNQSLNNFKDSFDTPPISSTKKKIARYTLAETKQSHQKTASKLTENFRKIIGEKTHIIKKLRTSQQKCRKQVASIKNVLSALQEKNLINVDNFVMLKNIAGTNENLLMRQISTSGDLSLQKNYEPELRAFALTLNFLSPSAYTYVRKEFNSCLPHPKILNRWHKVTEGNPGFSNEAFQCLRVHAEATDHTILCSLMLEEMAIHRCVEYDGSKYHGYIDMGTELDGDDRAMAKDVFVFLLVAINENWKIPVGYFLTDRLTAEQKKNLVLNCISLAHETGVQILSLTFNGSSTNMALAKSLGCSLESPTNLKTFFVHPDFRENIYIFPDPCHMLKLITNALKDLKTFEHNGNTISWEHIKKFHELQSFEKFNLNKKLKIEYNIHKMKVKYTAQIFSNSLADALEFCAKDLELPQFLNCQSTSNFVRLMNNLFDIFYSEDMKQLYFKKPIHQETAEEIFNFLNSCKETFFNLRCSSTGEMLLAKNRKTGFLGFLICIESLNKMYKEVIEDKRMMFFLPMYRFSQDHMELFFSSMKSQGGWNDDPTALQFINMYKKFLHDIELKGIITSNSVPLETVSIFHYSSSAMENINMTADRYFIYNELRDIVLAEHDYVNKSNFIR